VKEEALTMSDRIAVMSAGKVQQIGSPHDIYERPFNRFVADFIGDSNFFDARLERIDGDRADCRIGDKLQVTTTLVGDHSPGDRVTLAVRPEKVTHWVTDKVSHLRCANRIVLMVGHDLVRVNQCKLNSPPNLYACWRIKELHRL